jgi:cytochrome d ubiquinol oxidase subunit I
VANTFGWIFTEMGRQPWIVGGVLPTYYAVSPATVVDIEDTLATGGATTVLGTSLVGTTGVMLLTVVLYTLIYAVLAVVEVKLLLKYIKIGLPPDEDVEEVDLAADPDAPLSFAY